mmetsp:Transcript_47274/g.133324  ORF Transcript_47274/g.133324 Transcript_47274/m.133324 type:complete len:367 (-) Transcript_47274:76-1176(-)
MAGPATVLTLAALVAMARAAGAGCQAAGGGPDAAGGACDAEPDGVQPDDVQADALLQQGSKVQDIAPLAGGDVNVDAANKTHWHQHHCRLFGSCHYCGEDMYVAAVKAPWETMCETVYNAGSKSKCEQCGRYFQRKGMLQPGWRCEYGYWSGASLKRGADRTLAPMKPRKSFDLNAGTRGLGPMLVGTAPLPESLRGIFWQQDQQDNGAALTFAGDGSEGAWCNSGSLVGNRYRIRCCGENIFSVAAPTTDNCWADLIYDFVFDSSSAPTHGQIKLVPGFVGHRDIFPELLIDFEMSLRPHGLQEFPGSVVWDRDSYLFGVAVGGGVSYKLVQIVDEHGARIEPAWSAFAAYQAKQTNGATLYTRR